MISLREDWNGLRRSTRDRSGRHAVCGCTSDRVQQPASKRRDCQYQPGAPVAFYVFLWGSGIALGGLLALLMS